MNEAPALTPPADPPLIYDAFPGLWFDFMPNVVAADTGFELKLRIGLPHHPDLKVRLLAADGSELSHATVANPTTDADFQTGKLAVLSVATEPDPKLAAIHLAAGDRQITIHLRDPNTAEADVVLASLPNRDRPPSADHMAATARNLTPDPASVAVWATLGAHLATRAGEPVILRQPPRPLEPDRSGLITGPLHASPTDTLPKAEHLLLIAPAALTDTLKPLTVWTQMQEQTVQQLGPIKHLPILTTTATDTTNPTARLITYSAATAEQPFHPFTACAAAALSALDDPTQPATDRLIVILPWNDPAFGTDPREYALALDAIADRFRARRQAGNRALTELIVLGPFRHPSVPEKRHTMLESHVAERQQAQGFSWPDLPALNDPAQWRVNPTTDPVAVFDLAPTPAGRERIVARLKPLLDRPQ